MAGIYAKIDDVTNLSAEELVHEIYGENPDVIFDVIRRNRLPPPTSQTNAEALAQLVAQRGPEPIEVITAVIAAMETRGAEPGSTIRELATCVFNATRDLEPRHEREETLRHLAALIAALTPR